LINADTGSTTPTLRIADVPSGVYFVRVRARNSKGTSEPSNEVIVELAAGCSSAPAAPTALTVTTSESETVLRWTAPGGHCPSTSYVIEALGAKDATSFSTGSTATTFATSQIAPGAWSVRVRATNVSGLSEPSNQVAIAGEGRDCVAAPPPPTNVFPYVRGSSLMLTWRAGRGAAATSYVVEVGSAPKARDILEIETSTPATSWMATLGPGTYYVNVLPKNQCGLGGRSPVNEVSADLDRHPDTPDVVIARASGGRNTYFPTIERLQNGRLVVVYYDSPAHVSAEGRIAAVRSGDGGRTWSPPEVIVDTPFDDRDPSLMQTRDGTLLLSYFAYDARRTIAEGVYVARSTDEGHTWSAPVEVETQIRWPSTTAKIVELDNGDLIIPIYGRITEDGESIASIVRSVDQGRSWNGATEVEIAAMPRTNFYEPAVANLGESRLIALMRADETDPFSWESHSDDGGRSWSTPVRMGVAAQASDVLPLPSNSAGAPAALHAWGDWSRRFGDGRQTVLQTVQFPDPKAGPLYGAPQVLYRSHCDDAGQPSSVRVDDGQALTVYYDACVGFIGGTFSSVESLIASTTDRLALQHDALRFSIVSGKGPALVTDPQTVNVWTSSPSTSWVATADQPWVRVTPTSGIGSGALTVAVVDGRASGLPPGPSKAVVRVTGIRGVETLEVTATRFVAGTTRRPTGAVDSPLALTQGVTGSLPWSGWAIDDVQVAAVRLFRNPVQGEPAGAEILVGDAVLVDGIRPDVELAHPDYPFAFRAGFSFLLLTNLLPGRGNGTFTFHVYAVDKEGQSAKLGTRTITCRNATSTTPFGILDTPRPGETISTGSYASFAWALTPQPDAITDGSSINVLVDGRTAGLPSCCRLRPDIQAAFPGYRNTGAALGGLTLDTSSYGNGLHTITWVVTDTGGHTDAIGSHFFRLELPERFAGLEHTVTSPSAYSPAARLSSVKAVAASLAVRRGLRPATTEHLRPGPDGEYVLSIGEMNQLEVHLDAENNGVCRPRYTGYQQVGGTLRPLPPGSSLQPRQGMFYWWIGAGFHGPYRLVFLSECDGLATRLRLTVTVRPRTFVAPPRK
jgi:hypothetical protein